MAPAELEGHLLDHPDVADVCVVGIPDDFSGELPVAFVVVETNAAKRIRADSQVAEKSKAALMKVRIVSIQEVNCSHDTVQACRRPQSFVQAFGGPRVRRFRAQESER